MLYDSSVREQSTNALSRRSVGQDESRVMMKERVSLGRRSILMTIPVAWLVHGLLGAKTRRTGQDAELEGGDIKSGQWVEARISTDTGYSKC